jgi:hypothetical protein
MARHPPALSHSESYGEVPRRCQVEGGQSAPVEQSNRDMETKALVQILFSWRSRIVGNQYNFRNSGNSTRKRFSISIL